MGRGEQIELRGGGHEYRLGDVLAALKERGCSILVAGEVPVPTFRAVSRHLFGHPEEPRERVLIRLQPTASPGEWFPGDVGPGDSGVRIVDYGTPGQSGDADGAPAWRSAAETAEPAVSTATPDLGGCTREIESVAARAGALAPSQLRVGAFSLDALDGRDEMVEFVSTVSGTVREHGGMVHFHRQGRPNDELGRVLLDHVDAKLSVRKAIPGEPARQKWFIPGYGETPWIPSPSHE